MQVNGTKLKDFVKTSDLEVLYAGSDFDTALLTVMDVNRPGLQLLDFYDYFDPRRLQVIGKAEMTYLRGLSGEQRRRCFDNLFLYDIPALVLARELECPEECMASAIEHGRTILRTKEATVDFTSHTIEHLNRVLAPCVTRHGVLLDIHGVGVMITGDSGVGKSEAAIELIMRGHRLVADDAVELRRISNQLIGTAPEIIRHFIELRGIGVINVAKLFGMAAVKESSTIDLIINIVHWKDGEVYDRLGLESQYTDILGVKIPSITVPVTPGRNLAVIFEVAAMNNRQKCMGYNAAVEFTEQLSKFFQQSSEASPF